MFGLALAMKRLKIPLIKLSIMELALSLPLLCFFVKSKIVRGHNESEHHGP
jgi:hypothetical protein